MKLIRRQPMFVFFAQLASFAKPTYILPRFYQSAHSPERIGERWTVSRCHRSKGEEAHKEVEWWLRRIKILKESLLEQENERAVIGFQRYGQSIFDPL